MALQLHAGMLDRQVSIEVATVVRESLYGSPESIWSTLDTVWAQVLESSTEVNRSPREDLVNAVRNVKAKKHN